MLFRSQVSKHLLTQMKKSINPRNPGICVYHSDSGLKCAAGCLISDEEYTSRMSSLGWDLLCRTYDVDQKHGNLIYHLQSIHDGSEPIEWAAELAELAARFTLKLELNMQGLHDLLECVQESIDGERDRLRTYSTDPPTVESIERLFPRLTELQAKLGKPV